jgi:3'-phosphoadenosine 5'-phosphosulfate sulfotransferase (PAPS reductase)/FAD synthetase
VSANPYLITGPALISFSGGRSSAYMLYHILQAHGGALPEDVIPVFCNTGKEREETLRFVHECGSRWGVSVVWLERQPGGEFERVGLNSASRAGEPFAALIKEVGVPPNWKRRFCTADLKVLPKVQFAESLGWTSWDNAVGLRADEGHRVLKFFASSQKHGDGRERVKVPLAEAKVGERDVLAFWKGQTFDLQLRPWESNCDLCFLKGRGIRKATIRDDPTRAAWWAEQERLTGGFFDRRDRYAALAAEVRQQPHFRFNSKAMRACGDVCAPEDQEAA